MRNKWFWEEDSKDSLAGAVWVIYHATGHWVMPSKETAEGSRIVGKRTPDG